MCDGAENPLPQRHCDGHDRRGSGAERHGPAIKAGDCPPIDLLQKVADVGGDHVDQRWRRFEGLLFGEGFALHDRLLCQLRIPSTLGRKCPRVCRDVFSGFFGGGFVHRLAASSHRVSRTDVRARRHCRQIGGNRQQKPGGGRTRARRCDMDRDRSLCREHPRHDLSRRIDEPAWRPQREDNERSTISIGAVERLDHVFR